MGDWYLQPDPAKPGHTVWVYDRNAPTPHTDATQIRPAHQQEPNTQDLDALADDRPEDRPGDVGDWIDPNAPDPTGEEITHPDHPDYVEPWRPE